MRVKRIFVAGSGLMGAGIAQVCAQAGYSVTLMDIRDEMLEKGMKAINMVCFKDSKRVLT